MPKKLKFYQTRTNTPEKGELNDFEREVYERVNEKFSKEEHIFVSHEQVKGVFWTIGEVLADRAERGYEAIEEDGDPITLWNIHCVGHFRVRVRGKGNMKFPQFQFHVSNGLRNHLRGNVQKFITEEDVKAFREKLNHIYRGKNRTNATYE